MSSTQVSAQQAWHSWLATGVLLSFGPRIVEE